MSDDGMTSSSTSYDAGDGVSYDPIYETTTYSVPETTTYEATTYETPAYETTAYETPAYEVTTYSTEPTYSYDPSGAPEPYVLDPYATVTETGSTSYDSTDWSAVADVSGELHDSYLEQADVANNYWQMATDASIAGDSSLAYDLTQMSLEAQSASDASWSASNQAWTDMDVTTTETTYDVTYDTPASTYETSYDTGYAAPVDTSWSAAPVADTSWSAAPVDESWSASTDDSGY